MNRYEIFLKVAECGNITKCAQSVHYTQAGISHAIAALEKETGLTLFARTARGVTLTENGRRLLPSIQALVNDQHALTQAINQIGSVVAGTLRVGTFTSVSMQWLPRLIQNFTARHPGVEFDLQAGDYDQITEMLMAGKVDCGFLAAPVHEGLEFFPLYRDPMLAFLPKGHPLARKRSLTLDDLLDEELIIPAQGSD
ncbi:MAG: LysR family transcriptional regulator, partial [Collinsella bouchesdurhonensis]|nr:LysR family transcriptional regulator [Collinsella bouchesdurhonensis]